MIGNKVREAGRGQIMWESAKVASLDVILRHYGKPLEGFSQADGLISVLKIALTVR